MSRVRIVGGQWRSRMLPVPTVPGLRPTPDRVRETVFNWLGQDLSGWHVLDLFAGSGVLGFEAASRGAASVTLVERDARVAGILRSAKETLSASCLEIVRGDAVKFAAACPRRFDLVFLDPPYRQGWIAQVADHVERLLADEGRLYIEAEEPVDAMGSWSTYKRGRAGQVCYQLLRRSPP